MDTVGNKEARREIAMIKIAAPNMACKVVDWAMQAFGGAGTSNDYGLASMYATARLLRLADGPDEVHRNQLGKLELRRHAGRARSSRTSTVPPCGRTPDTAVDHRGTDRRALSGRVVSPCPSGHDGGGA